MWEILAGHWTIRLCIQMAGSNKSFQCLVFVLTQLHFGQWNSPPFCLPTLIVQWPASIFSLLSIAHDCETDIFNKISNDPVVITRNTQKILTGVGVGRSSLIWSHHHKEQWLTIFNISVKMFSGDFIRLGTSCLPPLLSVTLASFHLEISIIWIKNYVCITSHFPSPTNKF